MRVLVNQSLPVFGNAKANLATIERDCGSARSFGLDVAVFPELFLTGYNIGEKVNDLAEEVGGMSVSRLREIAADNGVAIVTGFAERRGTELFNSAIAISAQGQIRGHHNKVFLFGAREKQAYSAGSSFPVFELAGRACGLAICYDIEFPEVTRDLKKRGAEVVFVPTANMVYANLSGTESNQTYTGLSAVVLPDGKDLARAGRDSCVLICDLEPGLTRNANRPSSRQVQDLDEVAGSF
jgi:5-aminopentanamidase